MKVKNLFFSFRCSNCGEYRVGEKTFQKVLNKNLKKELSKLIKKRRACGAVAEFEEKCPKCTIKGRAQVSLKVLYYKNNNSDILFSEREE